MPRTKKGKKIMANMKKEYGEKKAKEVFYASIVKGKIKGAEGKGGSGKLAKAKATYAKKHKKKKSDGRAYENTRRAHFGIKKNK